MARGFTITQAGKKLLAELVTTGELKITRVMVGKGEVQQGQIPEQFTDLIQPVAQATSTMPVVKNGVISFIVEYRNDLNGGLQEGFWLKEFGVFAKDGEKEILLYYASLGEYPQYIEVYENGKVNVKKYPVSIVVADDVKVTIAYAALAFVTEERMKEFVEIEALPYLEGVLAESENSILTELEKKADKETVEQALHTKADTAIIQQALDQKADAQAVQTALDKKVDKESLAEELAKKANAETVTEELAKKADAKTMQQALDQKANEMEMLTELGKKADKENVIQELAGKADKETVKIELDKKADKEKIEEILQQIDGANIVLELDKKADKETVAEELTKKADAAHEHSADEITDGILPIERGGTGATTAANARTNLGITPANIGAAPSSHGTHVTFSTTTPVMDGTASAGTATTVSRSDHKHPTDTSRAAASHTHNYAGSSSSGGAATSAVKLQTTRTIDGMNFDGSANIVHFGVCSTAADVAEKTVALTGFVLAEGARVAVYFANSNTHGNPKLNVNGTGAKAISCIKGSWAPVGQWEANQIVEFVYYSSHWIMITANARRLYTARTITLSGDVTGSTSFDGSANKTITATLANSGVTAGTYGPLELVTKNNGTVWVSNNVGLHSTTATSTWTAKQACKVSFRWRVSSKSAKYDYLNITAAGTQILGNTGGSTEQTGTLTATLVANQTLVFTYRKDGSNNGGQDRAEISEVKYGAGTADPSTVIYENNIESYFTITNSTYGFYPAIPIPNITVDAKGRITKEQTIYIPSANNTRQEGNYTEASGNCAHAEGYGTAARGDYAHAEGCASTASGDSAHAEGYASMAKGDYSHAEGNSIARGIYSHAEGNSTEAMGDYSHVSGFGTIAYEYGDFAMGKYNKNVPSTSSTNLANYLTIGNGTNPTVRSNCFRVTHANGIFANAAYKTSGADYAELFQWFDDNPEKEDRVGLFVALVGERIQIAKPTDKHILGIVSGCPSILGDVYDDQWKGMYEIDIYGRPVLEEVEVPAEIIEIPDSENPEQTTIQVIREAHKEIRQKLNPDYDPTQEYIPRSERPEWAVVGMMGKLVVIDDGSCEENGWCTAGEGGIAIKSETQTKFRVMKRLDKNHIKVLVL